MNIFLLDEDFKTNVSFYHDKLITKMSTEMMQMMAYNTYHCYGLTSRRKAYANMEFLQKEVFPNFPKRPNAEYDFYLLNPAHLNHPSTIWLRESRKNTEWGLELCKNIFIEHSYRYSKLRDSLKIFEWFLEYFPYDKLPDVPMTDFRIAMNNELFHAKDDQGNLTKICDMETAVECYRKYFRSEKLTYISKRSPGKVLLHKWTKRDRPEWVTDEDVKLAIEKTKKENGWS